jgi:uncharacterized protein (TIGR02996 family)
VILISIPHDGTGYDLRAFTFTRDAVVIGRAPDCDLVLDRERVAPRHVRISRQDGALIAEDLRAQTTKLPVQVLRPGDSIRVAGMLLLIEHRVLLPEAVTDAVEQRFLDAIRQRPDDPETRTVYADWLEQRGHAARAEFLRLQLAAGAATSALDPAFAHAAERLAQLAPQVGHGWRVRVAMSFIEPDTCQGRSPAAEGSGPGLGFELVCPMRWDRLEPTDREGARMCRGCKTEVTYCSTIEQAATAAQEGRCIAIDLGARRRRRRQKSERSSHPRRRTRTAPRPPRTPPIRCKPPATKRSASSEATARRSFSATGRAPRSSSGRAST